MVQVPEHIEPTILELSCPGYFKFDRHNFKLGREMAQCARQLVLEPYLALLNNVRSSSHDVRSFKIL